MWVLKPLVGRQDIGNIKLFRIWEVVYYGNSIFYIVHKYIYLLYIHIFIIYMYYIFLFHIGN